MVLGSLALAQTSSPNSVTDKPLLLSVYFDSNLRGTLDIETGSACLPWYCDSFLRRLLVPAEAPEDIQHRRRRAAVAQVQTHQPLSEQYAPGQRVANAQTAKEDGRQGCQDDQFD